MTLRRLAILAPVALLLVSAAAAAVWWQGPVQAADGCPAEAPATLTDYVPDRPAPAMTQLACTGGVALYADAQVKALPTDRTGWVQPFVASLWQYLVQNYGACAVPRRPTAPIGPDCERFGHPKPLMVMMAGGRSGDGTMTTRFDPVSGFRNTLWASSTDWVDAAPVRDALVRQGCRLAESAGQGVAGAPAADLWGDAFASLCTFDFYRSAGRSDDLLRTFTAYTAATQNAGSLHARWFRDWMVPLWVDSSSTQSFGALFGLLSRDFPTEAANDGRSVRFSRALTLGELVHFTSAAVGQDLSTRAAVVFGSAFTRAALDQAKQDWPNLAYPALPCASGSDPCPAADIRTPGPQVSKIKTKVALRVAATIPGGGAVQYAAGGLPTGLTLDRASGIISGTPTASGPSLVTVVAGGQGANPGRVTFLWEVVEWRGSLRTADGRCLDNANSGTADGNPVRAWTCNGTSAQTWTGRNGAMLVQGRCLVVAGTAAAGAKVGSGTCDGSAAQNWRVDGGSVKHLKSSLCLSSSGGDGQLTLAACPASRWTLAEATTTGGPQAASITVDPVAQQVTQVGKAIEPVQVSAKADVQDAPMAYSAQGLPPGVTVYAGTGRISGTPSSGGIFDTTVTVAVPGQSTSGKAQFVWIAPDAPKQLVATGGQCLDGGAAAGGQAGPAKLADCGSAPGQQWSVAGGYLVTADARCLVPDGDAAKPTAGTALVVTGCKPAASARWGGSTVSDGTIRHLASGLCLSATGAGAPVKLDTCANTTTTASADTQRWARRG